jgi:hypothetical protein
VYIVRNPDTKRRFRLNHMQKCPHCGSTEGWVNGKCLACRKSSDERDRPYVPDRVEQPAPELAVARDHQSFVNISTRYTDGEPVQAAGMVYWNVIETEEKQAGLAGRAATGLSPKDLVLGVAFGATGVLLSAATDKGEPAKCTCELGILAVGNRQVFLLKLGRVNMLGSSANFATLPSQLADHLPKQFNPTKVVSFVPLSAASDTDLLRVHVLGKSPTTIDSAFNDGGGCLVVHAPGRDAGDSFGARSLATAIKGFASYPQPEEVIASFLVADSPPFSQELEFVFAKPDYVHSFVHFYKRQKKEVRRAWILAARTGPAGLKRIAEACATSVGRGKGNRPVSAAFGLFLLAPSIFALVAFAKDGFGKSFEGDGADITFAVLGIIMMFGAMYGGFILLYVVLWSDFRERRFECRMFLEGGGHGGSLDALLALLAWEKDWQPRAAWTEVETQLGSSPNFSRRLQKVLRGMKEEKRKAFINSAPPGLKEKLIRAMLTFKGVVLPSVTICFLAVWLACFVIGIYGVSHAPELGTPSIENELLFIVGVYLGFGGVIPAIVLIILQTRAWRSRRWVQKAFNV